MDPVLWVEVWYLRYIEESKQWSGLELWVIYSSVNTFSEGIEFFHAIILYKIARSYCCSGLKVKSILQSFAEVLLLLLILVLLPHNLHQIQVEFSILVNFGTSLTFYTMFAILVFRPYFIVLLFCICNVVKSSLVTRGAGLV